MLNVRQVFLDDGIKLCGYKTYLNILAGLNIEIVTEVQQWMVCAVKGCVQSQQSVRNLINS